MQGREMRVWAGGAIAAPRAPGRWRARSLTPPTARASPSQRVVCPGRRRGQTGFSGVAGNKGGVAIRMDVDYSSVCFINAHMAAGETLLLRFRPGLGGVGARYARLTTLVTCVIGAGARRHGVPGQSNVDERCRDYNTIMEGIVFSQNRRIAQHEYGSKLGSLSGEIAAVADEGGEAEGPTADVAAAAVGAIGQQRILAW